MWYEFITYIFDECEFKFGIFIRLFKTFTNKLSIFRDLLGITLYF